VSCAETAEPIDLPFGLWSSTRRTEGSTNSIVFARWRQYAHMGGHIGDPGEYDWTVRLAAAMRCYVKLLWPLTCSA